MSALRLEAQFVQAAFSRAPQDQTLLLPYDPQTGTWPALTTTQLGVLPLTFTVVGSNPNPTLTFNKIGGSGQNQPPSPAITGADGSPVAQPLPAGNYLVVFPQTHNWEDPGGNSTAHYQMVMRQGTIGQQVSHDFKVTIQRGPSDSTGGTGTGGTGTGTAPPTGTGTAPPTGTGTGGTGTGGTGTGGTGTGGTGTGGTGTLLNHWPPPWIIQWWQKQLPMAARRGIFVQPSERLFHQHLRANHFGRVALRLPTPFFHFRADQRPRVNPTDPTVVILNWHYSPNSSRPNSPPSVGGRPRR